MSGKKYLVTGAAGFIGAWTARRMIEANNEVWTIDNLTTGFRENLHPKINFIEGGCEDPKSIEQLKKTRFDAIYHIAGQSSGEISFDNPYYDLAANTESTLRLIEYALETKSYRFIYASTMSVYGEGIGKQPVAESQLPTPFSFYGVGKLASEHYLRIYMSKGLRPTSLRYFTVYGPGQNLTNLRQGMVSIFLAQLLFNEKVVVKGPLNRFRDYIYIDDIVDANLGVLDREQCIGKVYNVGTGKPTEIKTLLEKLSTISGVTKEIVQAAARTEGDVTGICADISALNRDMGFVPKYDLDKGLARIIDWAKEYGRQQIGDKPLVV